MTQFSCWLCFTRCVAPSSPSGTWAVFGQITVTLIHKFPICKMGITPKSVLSALLWICENTLQNENTFAVIMAQNNKNGLTSAAFIMTSLFMSHTSLNKIVNSSGTSHNSRLVSLLWRLRWDEMKYTPQYLAKSKCSVNDNCFYFYSSYCLTRTCR